MFKNVWFEPISVVFSEHSSSVICKNVKPLFCDLILENVQTFSE